MGGGVIYGNNEITENLESFKMYFEVFPQEGSNHAIFNTRLRLLFLKYTLM